MKTFCRNPNNSVCIIINRKAFQTVLQQEAFIYKMYSPPYSFSIQNNFLPKMSIFNDTYNSHLLLFLGALDLDLVLDLAGTLRALLLFA